MPVTREFYGMDLMVVFGAYYFILGPLLFFQYLMMRLGSEKELRLRQGLNVMGVSHWVYWLHWLIVATLINICLVFIQMICGYMFQFQLFFNTDFGILFTIFFTFGQCMLCQALFTTTLVSTKAQAISLAYGQTLICLMVDIVFSYSEFVMKLFYSDKTQEFWINRLIIGTLELIPAFNFTQAFGLVASYASKNMDWNEMRWTDGNTFSTEMFYKENVYHNEILGYFRMPSVHHIVMRI